MTSTPSSPRTRSEIATAIATGLVLLVGLALAGALAYIEIYSEPRRIDWLAFGVIAAALMISERWSRCWILVGPGGVVTPRWLFSFALLLIGSPTAAIVTATTASVVHSMSRNHTTRLVLARIGNTLTPLACSGLVLSMLGVDLAITELSTLSWRWGLAIAIAGLSIVLLSTAINATLTTASRKVSLVTGLRRTLGPQVTAEGALLSLAPIWVIGIDFSLVLGPLLAITTFLVFRSTRQALEQAHAARHDPLTGLMNRRAFRELITDAFEGVGSVGDGAVLLMDLDRFKDINDRLGHEIGDVLLVEFGRRLEESLTPEAGGARLGGDEFAALVPIGTDREHALTMIDQLHLELTRPLIIHGFPVSVGVSIGVAFAPAHGRSPSDLLRAADMAMYKAKRSRTSVEQYDNCGSAARRGRVGLLHEVGTGLERHEFFVHFQPQLRMSDGSVDTVEALIRWNHPEHGMILPGEFIGLVEQTDLIGPITETALRLATSGVLMTGDRNIRLAVNVSARSLEDRWFASHVLTVLDEIGMPADRLEIEVTERALVANPERTSYTLQYLREAGVTIAIDDFGAGYSSFETLRILQVDRVKIDANFVTGLAHREHDRAIVETVIDLAHRLGLDVVAEGVESTEIWDLLAERGCDIAQGFGIARPMPFPDLRGWLTAWNEVKVEQIAPREPRVRPSLAMPFPASTLHDVGQG